MSKLFPHNTPSLHWSWAELCTAVGAEPAPAPGPDIGGVKVDSRLIQPGDLFIALPGDPGPRFNPSYRSSIDGHDFLADAAARGAAGALVHRVPQHTANLPLIQVGDTYDALWSLGRAARARLHNPVVAITGSSGKTTAKSFLMAALQGYGPPGSFNNHIGVPLALANTPQSASAGVFEIGTNHPGEIQPLAEMVAPDLAVLLNVHSAHIENFLSWDALKEEKISIFKGLRDISMAVSEDILGLNFGHTFGLTEAAHARVESLTGDRATISLFGERLSARVPGGGMHRATTVAATLLVCKLLDRPLQTACELPEQCVPGGRGNLRRAGGVTVVDESYNANPQSMQAALASFRAMPGVSSRLAVLGEMLELGDASADAHKQLAPLLQEFDRVLLVGDAMQPLANELGATWYQQAGPDLLRKVCVSVAELGPGSAVMVKGSNRVFWQADFVNALIKELEDIDVSRVTS